MRQINPSFLLASFCAGALLLASAGCSSNPFTRSSDERSAGRVADDKRITKDVKTALKKEPVYKFDW